MVVVASKKPSDSTSVFLAHLIVLVVLLVVFALSFMAYVETLWMKTEIRKEARILQTELVGEEELEKVKNYMLGQFLSSITHVYGIAERYRSVWINGTDFDRVEENQRIIREAGATDVLKTAVQYLNIENSVICLSGQIPA